MSIRFGPAKAFGFLIGVGSRFDAVSVVKVDCFVPLFTDPPLADRWIDVLAVDGVFVELTATRSNDEMTSLLADIRSLGVTHVAVDPDPTSLTRELITIEDAIIGFGVAG